MAPTPFKWKKRMTGERKLLWAQILWTLELDGDIVGVSNANKELASRLAARGVETSGLGLQLSEMAQRAQGSLITREINGRLPVAIRLNTKKLPDNPFPPEDAVPKDSVTEDTSLQGGNLQVDELTPAVNLEVVEPRRAPALVPTYELSETTVGDLAAELVDVALRLALLASATPVPDDALLTRLGEATEEAARQRKKADDAATTIEAQRARIRTLDTMVETLERNMKAKLRGDDSGFRETDRLVRAVPRARG